MIGIYDIRVSERLQLKADLTATEALEIARQVEVQSKEGKKMREEVSGQVDVNRLAECNKKSKKKFFIEKAIYVANVVWYITYLKNVRLSIQDVENAGTLVIGSAYVEAEVQVK